MQYTWLEHLLTPIYVPRCRRVVLYGLKQLFSMFPRKFCKLNSDNALYNVLRYLAYQCIGSERTF